MALFRSIATVGGWTMGSRVLGFVRDILIAGLLGAGQVTDAFFVALQLPNVFRRLFAEGAFNAAFVPLFAGELTQSGRAAARAFAERVFGVMLTVLIAFSVLVEIFMPEVMSVIAGGFRDDPAKFQLAIDFARLTFPYLLFVSLAAMLSGILNTLERFVAAAAAPILLNIILIGALVGVSRGWLPDPGLALSWGVLLAGIGQLAWLVFACGRAGLLPTVPRLVMGPKVRRLFVLMGPGIIGAGVYQINVLIGVRLASELPEGSVSFHDPQWIGTGDRLLYRQVIGSYELESYNGLARVAAGQRQQTRQQDCGRFPPLRHSISRSSQPVSPVPVRRVTSCGVRRAQATPIGDSRFRLRSKWRFRFDAASR